MAKRFHYKKNRKGLSTIVVTVILVALSMAAIVLVWAFVNNLIKRQISTSESCFGNTEKITINRQYTCYEQKSATNYTLRFSLAVGDVRPSKIIVSVSSGGSTKSYTIINGTTISRLAMYSGPSPATILLPMENSGLSYNATEFRAKIDTLQIAPVFGSTQCEVSDSLSEIENCAFVV